MNAPVPPSEANAASKATAPVPVEIRYGDFHFSWWYVVVFVAMAWLALGVDPPFIPWIVPLMFAAVLFCAAKYTRERFRHAGPALTLDEKGLHWMPYEQGRLDVSWDEIEHLTWGSGGRGGDYVGIRLKHPEQRLPAGALWMYGRRQPHLRLRTGGMGSSAKALVVLIRNYESGLGR